MGTIIPAPAAVRKCWVIASFKSNPGTGFGYHQDDPSGENWKNRQEKEQFLARLGSTIRQTIDRSSFGPVVQSYVSAGREINGYAVFGVLLLPTDICGSHSHLTISKRDEFSLRISLLDAVAVCFMDYCWELLPQSFANSGFVDFPPIEAMLKQAGRCFMHTPAYPCDNLMEVGDIFYMCNVISTLTYERSDSRGVMILSRKHHMNVEQSVAFGESKSAQNYRVVRKLLQLPKSDEALLCDSVEIYGIGRISEGYDHADEDLFCIEFVGHAKWRLVHAGVPLMHVEYGVPCLPSGRRQVEQFAETFERLFADATPESTKIMAQIADAATRLRQGTILVISTDAKCEAERFGTQSIRISPQLLTEGLLTMGAKIDGAILASPDGTCHAIGVILDGNVNSKGSADRGARFNSAVRYVHGHHSACLALVVSDDGMIDIVPEYRPKMSRRQIESVIEDVKTIVNQDAQDAVSQQSLNKKLDWLSSHRFYLSEKQCDEINCLITQGDPKGVNSVWRAAYRKFQPDPEMDPSLLED